MRPVAVSTVICEGHPLPRAFEAIAAAGFALVEPAYIGGYMEFDETAFSDAEAGRVRGWLRGAGLRAQALSAHVDLGQEGAGAMLARRIRFARAIGAGILVTNAAPRARMAHARACLDGGGAARRGGGRDAGAGEPGPRHRRGAPRCGERLPRDGEPRPARGAAELRHRQRADLRRGRRGRNGAARGGAEGGPRAFGAGPPQGPAFRGRGLVPTAPSAPAASILPRWAARSAPGPACR